MTTLRERLEANAACRDRLAAEPGLLAQLTRLRAWQVARLRRSYADLASQPRYAPAVAFFIEELYGGNDLAPRDRNLRRAAGALQRLLPASALAALNVAIELELASQELDAAVARALAPTAPLTAARYALAYQGAAPRAVREAQLARILQLGAALGTLVRRPGVGMLLRLTRAPAEAAGLGVLQGFIERGYAAFQAAGGTEEFLAVIAARESQLLDRLYRGEPDPLREIQP